MPKLIDAAKKQRMLEMLHAGKSINAIRRELNLGKSTIYYWYKKVGGRRFQPLNLPVKFTALAGEVMGIFAGDGSQYHNKRRGAYEVNVHFGMPSKKYGLYVKKIYEQYFGKNFMFRKNGPTLVLRTITKEVFLHFENYLEYDSRKKHCTVKLRTLDVPTPFIRGFLKGFVDTDGSVSRTKYGKIQVFFFTTSEALSEQIVKFLEVLKIQSTLNVRLSKWKPLYVVRVRRVHVSKFLREVRPFKLSSLKRETI